MAVLSVEALEMLESTLGQAVFPDRGGRRGFQLRWDEVRRDARKLSAATIRMMADQRCSQAAGPSVLNLGVGFQAGQRVTWTTLPDPL